jgi:hypothetical protein
MEHIGSDLAECFSGDGAKEMTAQVSPISAFN